MAVFLFGVDWLWSNLLQLIGVLKFGGGGVFGSKPDEPPAPARVTARRSALGFPDHTASLERAPEPRLLATVHLSFDRV